MKTITAFLMVVFSIIFSETVHAEPLQNWRVAPCGAVKGAVTRKNGAWIFRTGKNICDGGVFAQRAEIATQHALPMIKGNYLFQTIVSMRSSSKEPFTFFQIHDGRLGCAPPLSVDVGRDGKIFLKSDIKTGRGESCIRGRLSDRTSKNMLLRDGTPQELKVLISFDGTGAFDVTLWLDGKAQITGRYNPSNQPDAFKPKKYFFKHGVYSLRLFDFEMVSTDLRVSRVRLK